ncbi:hypothetical protein C8T65DRAFT_740812 [Cerioporus squamosus]|nr:hypothetical protein C8T65DRAFT_740812 [Cerioporus squamosus]
MASENANEALAPALARLAMKNLRFKRRTVQPEAITSSGPAPTPGHNSDAQKDVTASPSPDGRPQSQASDGASSRIHVSPGPPHQTAPRPLVSEASPPVPARVTPSAPAVL